MFLWRTLTPAILASTVATPARPPATAPVQGGKTVPQPSREGIAKN